MRSILGCTLLLAALASPACHTTRPVSLEEINVVRPARVRVTDRDRSVVLVFPRVLGDTLSGYVQGKKSKLPNASVKQMTMRTPAHTRTTLLVVGIGAGLGGLFAVLSGSGKSSMVTAASGAPMDCEKHPEEPFCTGTLY
jgi:hypothetical protein